MSTKEKSAEKSSEKITESMTIVFSDGSEQTFNNNCYNWSVTTDWISIYPYPTRPQGLQRILFARNAVKKVVIQNAEE